MEKKETPTISLRGIRKLYRIGGETLAALDGIDLDIGRGGFAALGLGKIHVDEHSRLSRPSV